MQSESKSFIRILSPGIDLEKHDKHKLKTIPVSEKEGIFAVYCLDCKLVLVYIFSKVKEWDKLRAKAWVINRHKKDSWGELFNNKIYCPLILEDLENTDMVSSTFSFLKKGDKVKTEEEMDGDDKAAHFIVGEIFKKKFNWKPKK